jgi:hypothetical protein
LPKGVEVPPMSLGHIVYELHCLLERVHEGSSLPLFSGLVYLISTSNSHTVKHWGP